MSYKWLDASALRGETLVSVSVDRDEDSIRFETASGRRFRMHHSQDGREHVRIHDILGDPQSLLGSPLVVSREETSGEWPKDVDESGYLCDIFTWTSFFFETGTSKVRIRWLGESDGYWSELVQIDELERAKNP